MTIYDFSVKNLQGQQVSLKDYQGKLLLVVNTATHCGFTPQYEGLEKLYQQYHGQGFEILDFPCDQFGNQAPGSGEEIHQFCLTRYGVSFPQFDKLLVNGPDADPLFLWLQQQLPGLMGNAIKWNFTKFLIGRDGAPIRRFSPQTTPEKIAEEVVANL